MHIGLVDIELETQQMILGSHLKNIAAVEKLIDEINRQFIISTEMADDMWLVLNEAVANAIKHGNKFNPLKKVTLSVESLHERYICFQIKDQGEGFNPNEVPDPTSPERILEPNGRGVYLIKKLADKMEYSENGTSLKIYFDLYKS